MEDMNGGNKQRLGHSSELGTASGLCARRSAEERDLPGLWEELLEEG